MKKILALFLLVGSTIIFAEEASSTNQNFEDSIKKFGKYNLYGKVTVDYTAGYNKIEGYDVDGSKLYFEDYKYNFELQFSRAHEGKEFLGLKVIGEYGLGVGYFNNQTIVIEKNGNTSNLPQYTSIPIYFMMKANMFGKNSVASPIFPYLYLEIGVSLNQLNKNDNDKKYVSVGNSLYSSLGLGVEIYHFTFDASLRGSGFATLEDSEGNEVDYNYSAISFSLGYRFSL